MSKAISYLRKITATSFIGKAEGQSNYSALIDRHYKPRRKEVTASNGHKIKE
jgi:hypothetical protein